MNRVNKVDFVNLAAQHEQVQGEIDKAFSKIMENTAFILGEEAESFEREFAEYCEAGHCIGVNSGTSALHLALLACGIGSGDEVITVPNTFIATVEAISYVGAKPVFVDIDAETYTIDPAKIEQAITQKTKAVIPVHLYGQPANVDAILNIAHRHNLLVIEDACQAHGAEYKGKKVGALGRVGCFSFYPTKNLGAYGEGGAVVTNNEEIARKVKMLRDHGSDKKYYHSYIGFNYRMDAFQGAVLSAKLNYLDEWNEQRRKNAELYDEVLKACGDVITPVEAEYAKHVYHLYVIRTKRRDLLREHLLRVNIYTGIHYPIPIHLQKAYEHWKYRKGDFPISEKCADEILSLPMHPALAEDEISFICDWIHSFAQKIQKVS